MDQFLNRSSSEICRRTQFPNVKLIKSKYLIGVSNLWGFATGLKNYITQISAVFDADSHASVRLSISHSVRLEWSSEHGRFHHFCDFCITLLKAVSWLNRMLQRATNFCTNVELYACSNSGDHFPLDFWNGPQKVHSFTKISFFVRFFFEKSSKAPTS